MAKKSTSKPHIPRHEQPYKYPRRMVDSDLDATSCSIVSGFCEEPVASTSSQAMASQMRPPSSRPAGISARSNERTRVINKGKSYFLEQRVKEMEAERAAKSSQYRAPKRLRDASPSNETRKKRYV